MSSFEDQFSVYRARFVAGDIVTPKNTEFKSWIKECENDFASVVEFNLTNCKKIVYDFSAEGDSFLGTLPDPVRQTPLMWNQLSEIGAVVGIGRYAEDRVCYNAPQFATDEEPRSRHIGIDIFAPAGSKVFAPLDGVVHSFANNDRPLDYGGTIILEHTLPSGGKFYSLFGHLSAKSLLGLEVEKPIGKGQCIGEMGDIAENGGWIPHLHFQVIFDMFGKKGDFIGAVKPTEWDIWAQLCPDPNMILQMPENVSCIGASR